MATKRTTHRSAAGKKLYAKRSKTGQFNDIQTYKRAHRPRCKTKVKDRTIGNTWSHRILWSVGNGHHSWACTSGTSDENLSGRGVRIEKLLQLAKSSERRG